MKIKFVLWLHLIVAFCAFSQSDLKIAKYSGMCDASAAVAIDSLRFIVANDEDNVLRVFQCERSAAPLDVFDLSREMELEIDRKNPELDIEGAAWLNGRIFWITSHGRNKDGLFRPNRYRLFATIVQVEQNRISVKRTGFLYKNLIRDLIGMNSSISRLIKESSQLDESLVQTLSPDENGLNIEGLSASANGRSLYIGFRNPRPGKMALIIEMMNPEAVVLQQQKPEFGQPILLDFKGAGIRSMEYSEDISTHIIVAGAHNSAGDFCMYRWSGKGEEQPVELTQPTRALRALASFNPEALFFLPGTSFIHILGDDGDRYYPQFGSKTKKKKQCRCKDLLDPALKTFRDVRMDLGQYVK
jgi:hypothetical protein